MMTEDDSNKDPSNQIIIDQCTFLNNSNANGGAMEITNLGHVFITNTVFKGNSALQSGGAINFNCANYGSPSLALCSLNILYCIFHSNLAQFDGGAIKWNMYEPYFENLTFFNNSASVYGNNVAAVQKNLVQVSEPFIGDFTLDYQDPSGVVS